MEVRESDALRYKPLEKHLAQGQWDPRATAYGVPHLRFAVTWRKSFHTQLSVLSSETSLVVAPLNCSLATLKLLGWCHICVSGPPPELGCGQRADIVISVSAWYTSGIWHLLDTCLGRK